MHNKWIIGKPGGTSGPFWSVVSQSGITEDKWAEMLATSGNAFKGDFDTIHKAGKRLKKIIKRDIKLKSIIDEGSEDYVIRAVIEALYA
jgi:hypothetical protein